MSICILGDLHAAVDTLARVDKNLPSDCVAGIQVGDLGWYRQYIPLFEKLELKRPWYWIDGNHEDFEEIETNNSVNPNLIYMPRGSIKNIDGCNIFFCGGASSVDKKFRLAYNMDWSPKEDITEEQFQNIMNITDKVDIMITHCPPQSIIQKHFDAHMLRMFDLPVTWRDPNADKIEAMWNKFGNPPLYCGHMHSKVIDGNVRILNIDEAIII